MRKQESITDSDVDISVGEFSAAILFGFFIVILVVHAFHFLKTGSVAWPKLALVGVGCGVATWIGGRALLRIRTWRLAFLALGFGLLLIGLWTLLTGYHVEGSGQFKITRGGDRLAELDKVALGLVLIGGGFLIRKQDRKKT